MIEAFKRLGKHSAIYGLSDILNKAVGFILLPLYTRHLTPADYGVLEILTVTAVFVSVFMQMGLGPAIFKVVLYDEKQSDELLLSTAFYALIGFTGVCTLMLCILAPRMTVLLFDTAEHVNLVRIVLFTAFLDTVSVIPLAKLRMREKSIKYSVANAARFVAGLSLNIYFIAGLKKGLEGLVVASAIQSSLFAFVLVATLAGDLRLAFSGAGLREMLSFGLPLVPMGVAGSVLSMADRYFLRYYATLGDTGLYALGCKFGNVINLLVAAFQTAWPAVLFSVAKQHDAKKFYSRLLTYSVLGLTFAALGLSVLSPEVLRIMTTEQFYAAYRIVPLIALSHVFRGGYYVTAVGTNLKKKTQYQAGAVIVAAILHLILGFVLIPPYGMMGAAISAAISYSVMAAIGCASSLKFYPIDYEWGRLLKIVVVAVVLFWASGWVHTDTLAVDALLKTTLVLGFPLLLYLLGFYSGNELLKARAILRSRLMKLRMALGIVEAQR